MLCATLAAAALAAYAPARSTPPLHPLGLAHATYVHTAAFRTRSSPAFLLQQGRQAPRWKCSDFGQARRRNTGIGSLSSQMVAEADNLDSNLLAKHVLVMFSAAAVLGPLCDGCHSRHDVLHYTAPSLLTAPNGQLLLESCWWVPVLFGIAGIILGVSHPVLDRAAAQNSGAAMRGPPGWRATILSIGCFCTCYELSGVLAQAAALKQVDSHLFSVDLPLLVNAAAIFAIFERSAGGLGMALLTAVVGPVVEIGLIKFGLYHYSHPDFWGIPSWITYVYAAGSPAVGALGRQTLHELRKREQAR